MNGLGRAGLVAGVVGDWAFGDPTLLSLARAVQGVGGAALFAVSLALVAQEFPAGRQRGTAMGLYGATIGMALAISPLVGGGAHRRAGIDGTVTAAHIHVGSAVEAGDVVVGLFTDAALSGTDSASGCVSGVSEELIKAIRQNPENYYVNIHSTVFPAGAIRGQLGN